MRQSYPLLKLLLILAALLFCILFLFSSVFGFYFYIREFLTTSESDDRSLLFWYLPLLFMGIFSAPLAAGAGVVAYKTIKSLSPLNDDSAVE